MAVKQHTGLVNPANLLTLVRVVLAPVFFGVYMATGDGPFLAHPLLWAVVLWIIFIVSELTDMFDGMAARKLGQTSDFGRLFDPFADTLTQLSLFLCFVVDGILPPLLYLAVLYREFSMLFLRNLILRTGITMGARMGGKIKTVTYIAAAAFALFISSLRRLSLFEPALIQNLILACTVLFAVSVVLAFASFADYAREYL
ncbi:MAG: CDP-diacylglycerol--glycerol-3-phosphate 3-phosphatidyltransferase, partial [Treponema sp.]|nr:CDP-diacylglycerol--glycerol-3-phosphate 3-phosphatidyltransferase [Treponema sp.]